jgi:hypothetical protein
MGKRHVCGPNEYVLWTDRSNNRSLDESKLTLAFWRRLPQELHRAGRKHR